MLGLKVFATMLLFMCLFYRCRVDMEDQKRALGPLELELEMVERCQMASIQTLGIELVSSKRTESLNCPSNPEM